MARKKKQDAALEGDMQVETMAQYLARGGKVTVCPPGMRSEEVSYRFNQGRGRKRAAPKAAAPKAKAKAK